MDAMVVNNNLNIYTNNLIVFPSEMIFVKVYFYFRIFPITSFLTNNMIH